MISWNPPAHGSHSSYKLKISSLSGGLEPKSPTITVENVENSPYVLRDLTPGATYQVQAFTVFENKESAAYTSRNFTTSKFEILFFRIDFNMIKIRGFPFLVKNKNINIDMIIIVNYP